MVYAFAHRGGRSAGPDNRIETFHAALAAGATGLETDAWLTSDGVVVLDHDGVHRAAGRRGVPMGEVRHRDLPSHIATLDGLYRSCGTLFDLAVDVHGSAAAAAVVEIAAAHGATARLWLVTESLTEVAQWRAAWPAAHLAHTVGPHRLRRRALAATRGAGADAVNARAIWWTRRRVGLAHAEDLSAFAYAAHSARSLRRALRQGCDGLFSDHVDRMAEAVATA